MDDDGQSVLVVDDHDDEDERDASNLNIHMYYCDVTSAFPCDI